MFGEHTTYRCTDTDRDTRSSTTYTTASSSCEYSSIYIYIAQPLQNKQYVLLLLRRSAIYPKRFYVPPRNNAELNGGKHKNPTDATRISHVYVPSTPNNVEHKLQTNPSTTVAHGKDAKAARKLFDFPKRDTSLYQS